MFHTQIGSQIENSLREDIHAVREYLVKTISEALQNSSGSMVKLDEFKAALSESGIELPKDICADHLRLNADIMWLENILVMIRDTAK